MTAPVVEDDDLLPRFYLVYDPIKESPHQFEVFLIPDLWVKRECKYDGQAEWPPSQYTVHVFSSATWKWEERSFVRQGEPAGTYADAVITCRDRHGIYFQGALYVHCQNHSVMRYIVVTSFPF